MPPPVLHPQTNRHASILTSSLLSVDGPSQDRERGFQLHFAGANEDRLKEARQRASELTESLDSLVI